MTSDVAWSGAIHYAAREVSPNDEHTALPEAAKERPDVIDQQIGHLMSSVVTASVEFRPLDDVLVIPLGEAANGVEVVGEYSDADRRRGRLSALARCVRVFVVDAG